VVGRTGLLEHGVTVKLRVRRGVVAAVEEFLVCFPHAVIGKWMPWNLAPGQSATIGERGQEDGINSAFLLQNVENPVGPLIGE
jgi:hypothetical protein